MTPPENNNRVTLAILQNDIHHLTKLVANSLEDHEERIRTVEKAQARYSIQGRIETGVAAAIAAVVGVVGNK